MEKRRAKLNRYIEQLVAVADVWRVPAFVHMLDGPREILASKLATLWEHNAEKVRAARRTGGATLGAPSQAPLRRVALCPCVQEFAEVQQLIEGKEWEDLVQSDQLTRERAAGRVFQGFSEGKIAFPPTYVPARSHVATPCLAAG